MVIALSTAHDFIIFLYVSFVFPYYTTPFLLIDVRSQTLQKINVLEHQDRMSLVSKSMPIGDLLGKVEKTSFCWRLQ